MPLSVSEHPIVQHSLAGLRDSTTQPEEFRVLARRVITFLLYEATSDLRLEPVQVDARALDGDLLTLKSLIAVAAPRIEPLKVGVT